ncbi:MAG: 6-phosphofructokinase [Gammaproteobacteria bacterium RIFCSPHIGHO2_02_FULL_42_13]|nr:MAG: 6-phosphofructokinase [Gammaproteobacteria bacterium RIFCSPHIGHO2_02_FULL_42_13]OGT70617.1 MAG: 6-phosphofructokinase [Gammaproteobacteria bacterium RIFCSPLOWO2_02_FULL_42_9]
MSKNIFYAQSGGVTAVINATACGVIETARKHKRKVGKVYAGLNGIVGALNEELIDTSKESAQAISALRYTPGGAFGSCRYKMKSVEENRDEYEKLIRVFKKYNIGYFFYNGGGDSQDTANKIAEFSKKSGYPLTCIGIPKTIDNDLPFTDSCPGFGSVAKYVAVSIREAGFDIASMAKTSTKVFVMEVMGRHAGWIAAAAGVAAEKAGDDPHIILLPEVVFDETKFLEKVKSCVERYDYCTIVVSEGVKDTEGKFLSDSGLKDAFGHAQLGGVAPVIANLVKNKLGYKYHWAVCDYLQRAARHIASKVDVDQAYALGKAAVEYGLKGENAIMPIIVRKKTKTYSWKIDKVKLSQVANVEKFMPKNFITKDGFGITKACRNYILPLIQGEDYPPYKNGLPVYVKLKKSLVSKKITIK